MSGPRRERGLRELYRDDPERVDAELWGTRWSRRDVLIQAGRGTLAAVLSLPFGVPYPRGFAPAALADSETPFVIPGKDSDLVVLNDRPLNVETPAHLLDDPVTPIGRLFVRNNGIPPAQVNAESSQLRIDGEAAASSRQYSIAALRARFATHTYRLQLECAGNGRAEFDPPVPGNQWTTGAIGCAEYTGVRLRDVLKEVGVRENAVYIGYEGADHHLSGDPNKRPISRGVPMAKALQDETLLAWAINGEPLPLLHGAPLRLVCAGWPASASGKWLRRIMVRNRVHDGAKMGGSSYRVPCEPIARGAAVPDDGMCIIESMPVKSLITAPRSGVVQKVKLPLSVRGHAWAGEHKVARVEISADFGQHWVECRLDIPANRLAWQRFRGAISLPKPGYYELWARATDSAGRSQPMVLPGWNPKGYLNNACHRIAVRAVA